MSKPETYDVSLKVTGYYRTTVRAGSYKDAERKAIEAFEEADFGELEDIDCEISSLD